MLNLTDLQNELKNVWNPSGSAGTPASKTIIRASIETIQDEISGELKVLTGVSEARKQFEILDDFSTGASGAVLNVADELNAANKLPSSTKNREYLILKLNELNDFIRGSPTLIGGKVSENTRAFYQDAGRWAEHFSMVRMTVTTFFVLISWGVISAKWDDFSRPLGWAAIGVWVAAGFFLWIFTRATYAKTEKQKELKNQLESKRAGDPPELDGWNLLFRTACSFLFLWWPPKPEALRPRQWRLIWLPVLAFNVLSICFGFLVYSWANHDAQKKITWIAIVEPQINKTFTITNEATREVEKFQSVASAQSATNMQALLMELTNIQNAISNAAVKASPTNSWQARETGLFIGIGHREIK